MNTTTNILSLIDYSTLCRYAKTCCRQKRLPEHVIDDIAHSAWIECQRRGRSVVAKENPGSLARKIMFTSIQNCIKQLKAQYAREAPNLPELKGEAPFSDYGSEAERIFCAADNWENPFWLRLFNAAHWQLRYDASRKEVSPLAPRCVKHLLADSRLPIAREKLGISQPAMGTILEILKSRFDLCFRAYEAYRRLKATFTF